MNRRTLSIKAAAAASFLSVGLLAAGQAAADTLTFDTPEQCGSGGDLYASGACSTNGFTFTELVNGTTFQGYAITATSGATFSMTGFEGRNGSPATSGVLHRNGDPVVPGVGGFEYTTRTQDISVVGTRADGTAVTFAYNNFGPVETFALGASFTDLVLVRVTSSNLFIDTITYNVTPSNTWIGGGGFTITRPGALFAIDNLQVTSAPVAAIPEPSTVILFGISLMGLGLVRYRRGGRDVAPSST